MLHARLVKQLGATEMVLDEALAAGHPLRRFLDESARDRLESVRDRIDALIGRRRKETMEAILK